MPTIAANPATSIQHAAKIGSSTPLAPKTQAQKQEALTSALSRTDIYVNSTAQIAENAILSLFNSYSDTQTAMNTMDKDGALVVTDFTNVGGSIKRAAIQRTVTSSLSNGWQLVRGKVTLAEAGGRVVGDVTASAAANGVGALATNAAVWGLAKAGASSLPVMVGGMVVGWAANNATHRLMGKFGVTAAITDKTTQLLQSVSNN